MSAPERLRRGPAAATAARLAPGLLAAGVLAALATALDASADRLLTGTPLAVLGTLGAPVVALLLGVVLTVVLRLPDAVRPGLGFTASRVLQAAVVVLGLTVTAAGLAAVGLRALPVVVVAVLASVLTANLLGRALGVSRDLRTLIGVGTGICGASAVAATAGVLRARAVDVSYALSTVVLFNLVAVLSFPVAGRALGLSDAGFGIWAGSAVNDTSAVVAVATSWGGGALAAAVVVKLARVLALVPTTLVLAWRRRDAETAATRSAWRLVPGFVVLFVVAVLASVAGLVPATVAETSQELASVLVTLALAAVGLSTRLRDVLRAGPAPLLLGGLVWVVVALATLGAVGLLGLA